LHGRQQPCFEEEAGRCGTIASVSDDFRAVFVFSSDDPAPIIFASLSHAAGWMEAIDVEHGGYDAVFTLDGLVVEVTTDRDRVVLTPTAQQDEAGLRERIRDSRPLPHLGDDREDLVAYANAVLLAEWEARWPKRPRWLARRLHGEGPLQI
jgi:hypothetical protein